MSVEIIKNTLYDDQTDTKNFADEKISETSFTDNVKNPKMLILLPSTYILNENDVLIGISKNKKQSKTNRGFHQLVQSYMKQYSSSQTKLDKSSIILSVVNQVEQNGGSFIKRESKKGRYYIVSNHCAVS